MKPTERPAGWHFTDDDGSFELKDPHLTSALYFPLVNEAGLMSVVTPTLHGDIKTDHNTFLLPPVSVIDLHNNRTGRNFWVYVTGSGPWSAVGASATQIAQRAGKGADSVRVEAGFLWHRLVRSNRKLGLRAEITNFAPPNNDPVELMEVALTNISTRSLEIVPTAAIPIYGRSADNLRDHRHVTSLLSRTVTHPYGVVTCPTLSFDERGHKPNQVMYCVLGAEENGTPPLGFFADLDAFAGEGGCLDWPEAVVKPGTAAMPTGSQVDGYEALGGLRFQTVELAPGETRRYVLVLGILKDEAQIEAMSKKYAGGAQFNHWLECNQAYWKEKLEEMKVFTGDPRFDLWFKWVSVQPVLRRMFGNSFLPYHDYGHGGRGWRDLWQDCLALLMMEPDEVPHLLFSSFAGVRIDGSNATIIGAKPGDFKADRNNISRVWMDHGAWPFLTTHLYIQQSGDLDFLLRKQVYFKDQLIDRARKVDQAWNPDQGTRLRNRLGEPYQGSILEHLLVQHLTAFYNVGVHNNLKLEDADWNDGMDMASENGESVAFSALYASNLRQLSQMVLELEKRGVSKVELAAEIVPLLDRMGQPVDYDSVHAKRETLRAYFSRCEHTLSGQKMLVTTCSLASDLESKAAWLVEHIRQQEWITTQEGYAWFNGYYDNDARQVEGDHPGGARMTLTGQVFALMGGIATAEQANQVVAAVDHYLLDESVGGYRLNTNFGEVMLNLGRCFGFAYGHKENGAMFSHMAVMYANALYQRGFVEQAYGLIDRLYRQCIDFNKSRMYPGIPEYFDARGRGMYPYLTGSASWLLLTLLCESFGVQGSYGNLSLGPRLVSAQFDAHGVAGIRTQFAERCLEIFFHNPENLNYGQYQVQRILVDGVEETFDRQEERAVLRREIILELSARPQVHRIDVTLG